MTASLKANLWRIGVAVAVVAVLAGGLYVTRFRTTEAFPAMPAEQQDYWAWVTTINRGSEAALEAGVALLAEHPQIERLYLRLADLCLEKGEHQACTNAFNEVFPPTPLAALYRDAARAQLVEGDSTHDARPLWQFIASSDHLDPGVARLIVDAARANAEADWTADLEQRWNEILASDSTHTGAAFGLGYLAVLRGDWDRGEHLLTHTTNLLPHDPEAYRELGRIYYTTGRPDDFESALTRGIDAAKYQHDVEKELILRGNLGLGVKQLGELDRAEAIFRGALLQSRAIGDQETEGFNLYRLAAIRIEQNRLYEALTLLDEAAALY
ncbi:MAG TPA: hypothetical protein VF190_01910, partial [Rhodothermales bacterium]